MIHFISSAPKIDLFQHFRPFWWVIPVVIIFYIVKEVLRSPNFKGWVGEKTLKFAALTKLDPNHYKVLNDLYLPRPDGNGTTQLDHVVISVFGVFVIETKNYDNWIFGSATQPQWTQKVFKKSYRFQNPIHQNDLHIKALALFLEADKSIFHNLVFFVGECSFKTEMPPNVLNKGFRNHIESYQNPILTPDQADYIYKTLLEYDQKLDRKTIAKEHVKNIKDRGKF
jgi:restriction system protein